MEIGRSKTFGIDLDSLARDAVSCPVVEVFVPDHALDTLVVGIRCRLWFDDDKSRNHNSRTTGWKKIYTCRSTSVPVHVWQFNGYRGSMSVEPGIKFATYG